MPSEEDGETIPIVVPPRKRRLYSEQQAVDALNAISSGMSVRKAARRFGVPKSTLNNMKKGYYSVCFTKPEPPPILTHDEEKLLADWAVELYNRAMPITKRYLLNTVQKIVLQDK